MSEHRVHLWMVALFGHALLLARLYPDGHQQDAGYHFLLARWSWDHPQALVDPWSRPLFTALYSIPAQLGYLPARLLTAALLAATGYVTYRLARHLGFERAWLAYPLLALHPNVMLLSFATFTETLFAFLLAVGLLLHFRGKPLTAAVTVSFLPTIRPEGFFIGILWGVFMLLNADVDPRPLRRLPKTLLLLVGSAAWVVAAWSITGDPLFVLHAWPYTARWAYDPPTLGWYAATGIEYAGPVILLLALAGGIRESRSRRWMLPALALYFFALQAVIFQFGLFRSAGFPRYFVPIAPVTTLLALSAVEGLGARLSRRVFPGGLAGALLVSWVFALSLVDCHTALYDARAVRDMYEWYRTNVDKPVQRLVWSQAYMCILFDQDVFDRGIERGAPRERNLEDLRRSPPGTLVFWDAHLGPAWFDLRPEDFEAAGYRHLRSREYHLEPLWVPLEIMGHCRARHQEMHLYYKDLPEGGG